MALVPNNGLLDLWSDDDQHDLASRSEETSSCHRSLALSVEKEAGNRYYCQSIAQQNNSVSI